MEGVVEDVVVGGTVVGLEYEGEMMMMYAVL